MLRVAAALAFVVSFALPAADLGGASGRSAPGLMVAMLAGYVLPLAIRLTGQAEAATRAYALAAGGYFLLLLLQNAVMLYALWVTRRGRTPPAARWLALEAAVVPAGALLVDYERLYRALGLVGGDGFTLLPGYYVWTLSFVLLAAALWTGAPAGRERPAH